MCKWRKRAEDILLQSFLVVSGVLIMADENSAAAGKPLLLTKLRTAIRARHCSLRTEEAYVYWTRFYVRFHGTWHPAELNEQHVAQFLIHLAVEGTPRSNQRNLL